MLCDNNKNQITEENLVKLMLNFVGDTNLISEAEFTKSKFKDCKRDF